MNGKYKSFIFYEGLVSELTKNGNDVMEIITNDFLEIPWNGSNNLKFGIKGTKLMNDLIHFKPDLVISFNNSSIEGLEDKVSCPIVIWDADHIYHFNDLDKLKTNKDRYLFFCSQSSDIDDCQKILGVDPKKCFLVKPATSIRSDIFCKKKRNILFIGTPFGTVEEKEKLFRHRKAYMGLAREVLERKESTEDLIFKYRNKIPKADQTILDFGSAANRSNTLAHVAPLGLNIHGGDGWLNVGLDFSLDIFYAYDPRKIYSVSQTQEAYNSSRIGLNINHSQAKSGYSWRVMDILASSAVLVSNYSQDLADELGDLSKEIFYDNPQEAYILCSKLLKNEELRKDIVRQSNEIVRRFHTWEVRVNEIEKILKIGLVHSRAQKGRYILLDAQDYRTTFGDVICNPRNKKRFLMRVFFFLLPYGLVKFLSGKSEESVFFATVKNFKISDGLRPTFLVRLLRFILPYGFVHLVRLLRKL